MSEITPLDDLPATAFAVRGPVRASPKPKDVRLPAPLRLKSDIHHPLADERGQR
jgi:hypothetical protein